MQLPVSGPPHAGTPATVYHGPPPNVMVQPGGPPPPMLSAPVQTPPHLSHQGPPHPHVTMHMAPEHAVNRGHPCFNLEYKIFDLNRRLQQRSEDPDNASLWWDAFVNEFFEDDATLTLSFCLEDGPKRYTIGRTLIPRYFRSIFEGGVLELYYVVRCPREAFQQHTGTVMMDCEHATMVTQHCKPFMINVQTEGRLFCEFGFSSVQGYMLDDLVPRIRMWHFIIRNHTEYIPRCLFSATPEPGLQDQLSKNITRQGMTNVTLNYLRLCVILEPMQELMILQKSCNISPKECLKRFMFHKWQSQTALQHQRTMPPAAQAMLPPEEPPRPPSKRRKRKGSSSGVANSQSGGGKKKTPASPAPSATSFPITTHVDVMVVSEPSMMGGEFGDEDERLISRLENTQYDPGAAAAQSNMVSVNMNAAAAVAAANHPQDPHGLFDPNIGWSGAAGPPAPPSNLQHMQNSNSSNPNTPIGGCNPALTNGGQTTPIRQHSLNSSPVGAGSNNTSATAGTRNPAANVNGQNGGGGSANMRCAPAAAAATNSFGSSI